MLVEKKVEEEIRPPWVSHHEQKRRALAPFIGIEKLDPKTLAIIERMRRRGKSKSALENLLRRHAMGLLS